MFETWKKHKFVTDKETHIPGNCHSNGHFKTGRKYFSPQGWLVLAGPWSSLVEGDEQLDGPNRQH